ncbi:hypothetical protein WR25_07531 [Diploscapter pachys]|uniref:GTP-binding protein Rheb n=1 Tax=Diploscapter pachys TaxID=2018661 RepID=A0A2A2JKR0_9BILA|nr:hypothetical protein WR25_07531 [Diploscapter pachys]
MSAAAIKDKSPGPSAQSPPSGGSQESAKKMLTRKIAVMGYPCVGKSSLTLRFVQGEFPDVYDTTIEDLHQKNYHYNGREYNLRITDTAGQQEFSIFPRSCSVDIDGYVLVYAIDDRKSFETIQMIYEKVIENVGGSKVPLLLVGNKVDLQHSSRVVPQAEAKNFAEKWHARFIEVSAKDNLGVRNAFEGILDEIDQSRGIVKPKNQGNKGGCTIS